MPPPTHAASLVRMLAAVRRPRPAVAPRARYDRSSRQHQSVRTHVFSIALGIKMSKVHNLTAIEEFW
eukprot:3726527-Pleurochrysis_carterae.AAC.1